MAELRQPQRSPLRPRVAEGLGPAAILVAIGLAGAAPGQILEPDSIPSHAGKRVPYWARPYSAQFQQQWLHYRPSHRSVPTRTADVRRVPAPRLAMKRQQLGGVPADRAMVAPPERAVAAPAERAVVAQPTRVAFPEPGRVASAPETPVWTPMPASVVAAQATRSTAMTPSAHEPVLPAASAPVAATSPVAGLPAPEPTRGPSMWTAAKPASAPPVARAVAVERRSSASPASVPASVTPVAGTDQTRVQLPLFFGNARPEVKVTGPLARFDKAPSNARIADVSSPVASRKLSTAERFAVTSRPSESGPTRSGSGGVFVRTDDGQFVPIDAAQQSPPQAPHWTEEVRMPLRPVEPTEPATPIPGVIKDKYNVGGWSAPMRVGTR